MAAEANVRALTDGLRDEAAALLARHALQAFLRRARSAELFVTDAPRRCADPNALDAALRAAVWVVLPSDGLLFLSPDPEKLRALEAVCQAQGPLAERFRRFQGLEIDREGTELIVEGLKLLWADGDASGWEKRVRQRAALCLRRKTGGGGLYLCAAILAEL